MRKEAPMARLRSNLVGSWVFVLVGIWLSSGQAVAESIPTSSLPDYKTYRAELINSGWVPDYNFGAKNDDGSPMYVFPEVVCGNKTCSSQWIAKSDRRRVVIVLWMDSDGTYKLAPQIEFPD